MKWIRDLRQFVSRWVGRRSLISLGIGTASPGGSAPERMVKLRKVERESYHLNDPGPFYSEKDGCIICLAPQHAAPELMRCYEDPSRTGARSHCFFARQPETPEEVSHAIKALAVSCVENLRYRGSDPKILKRLCEMGYRHLCDVFEQEWDQLI